MIDGERALFGDPYAELVTEGPMRGYNPEVHEPTRLRTRALLTEQLDAL